MMSSRSWWIRICIFPGSVSSNRGERQSTSKSKSRRRPRLADWRNLWPGAPWFSNWFQIRVKEKWGLFMEQGELTFQSSRANLKFKSRRLSRRCLKNHSSTRGQACSTRPDKFQCLHIEITINNTLLKATLTPSDGSLSSWTGTLFHFWQRWALLKTTFSTESGKTRCKT